MLSAKAHRFNPLAVKQLQQEQADPNRQILVCCNTCQMRAIPYNNPAVIKWHQDPALRDSKGVLLDSFIGIN